MVHTVAFCSVEERELQHVTQTCLPPTFKTTRVTTQNAAISTLKVAAKTWKLMRFLYLNYSLRDIVGCVNICAPDTLDVWHECLCLVHYVVTREAWNSWTPRHVNHNKLFLRARFYGLALSVYFFTLNSFVSWPVIFSISFSCRIVYITWRELHQNCSKKFGNFRGESCVGRHTLEWSVGRLTFKEEDHSLSASAVRDSVLTVMAVAVHNWLKEKCLMLVT
jgi:hypothetical protein